MSASLPSARQYPSYGDCLEVKREYYQNCSVLVSSSCRSRRLGLSHWDPYAVRRGGCLELYYCNMVVGGVVLVGFKPYLKDQLASFSALTLLVWSYDL